MTNPFYKLNETLANIGREQDKIAEQVAKATAEVKTPARITLEESLKQDMKSLMEDASGGAAQSNTLESGDKWIQKAHVKKGGLHKALGVPQDKKIPKGKIEKASHSKDEHLRHMAQFAKNVANEDGAGGIHGKFPDPMSAKDQHKKMNPPASLEEDDMMEFIKSKLAPAKTRQANGMKHANAHGGLEFEDGHKPAWLTAAQKRAERAQGADVEEGMVGQAAGTIAGGALGGPVGAAIGGAIGNNLTNEEESLEEQVSRKHFQQVADLLKNIPDEAKRKEMALHHAHIFAQQNPRFDIRRFGQAAGVDLEECAMWEELKGGQKKLDRNHNGSLDANDFAMLRGDAEETDEGWDDAMALGRAAANQKPAFSRHDVKDTGYSKVYTRKPETFDEPEGGEVDPNAPKRGRGRPALNKAPAPKYTTKNATGARKSKTKEVDEETAEAGKRHFFDKLAPAAKKVAKVVSKVTTGKEDSKAEKAGKKVAKDIEHDEGNKAKGDNKAEKAGKKVTKDIEFDDKKDKKEKKVEETTTAGSVAPSATTHPAASAMGVGQGVYESINSEVEKLIAESFNLEMNKGISDEGETDSGITITADSEDADMLKDLLKNAGIDLHGHSHELGDEHSEEPCGTCGGVPCQCDDMGDTEVIGLPGEVEFEVDEAYGDTTPTENDELSWPTNQMTTGINQSTDPISNDLNKDKTTGQEVGAVTPVNQVKEADEGSSFLNLYKAFAKIK